MPPPIAQTPDETIEEVLLTPRVLDHGSFLRYSESLKDLIRDAAGRAGELTATASETERLCAAVRETSGELRQRIETGARLIPTIDQRVAKVEALLAEATDRASAREEIEQQIAHLADERLAEVSASLDAAIKRFAEKIVIAEARAEAAEGRLAELTERLAEAESRATAAAARLPELETCAARIDAVIDEGRGMPETLRASADEVVDGVLARLREAEARSGDIQQACDRAEAILGERGLSGAVRRGEEAAGTLRAEADRLASLTQQAEVARGVLTGSIAEAAGQIDALDATRERLSHAIDATLRRAQHETPAAERSLGEIAAALDALEARRSTIEASTAALRASATDAAKELHARAAALREALESSMQSCSLRVEQAGEWMGRLVQRAQGVAKDLQAATERAERSLPAPTAAAVTAPRPATSDAPIKPASSVPDATPTSATTADATAPASAIRFRARDL